MSQLLKGLHKPSALLLSLNGGASSNLDSFHNAQLPDEIRVVITSQLQTLSGATKGLTRAQDLLLIVDELSEYRTEAERLPRARDNYRMVKVREDLFTTVRHTTKLWSTDAGVSDVWPYRHASRD